LPGDLPAKYAKSPKKHQKELFFVPKSFRAAERLPGHNRLQAQEFNRS
jgi:hypothetical protein